MEELFALIPIGLIIWAIVSAAKAGKKAAGHPYAPQNTAPHAPPQPQSTEADIPAYMRKTVGPSDVRSIQQGSADVLPHRAAPPAAPRQEPRITGTTVFTDNFSGTQTPLKTAEHIQFDDCFMLQTTRVVSSCRHAAQSIPPELFSDRSELKKAVVYSEMLGRRRGR